MVRATSGKKIAVIGGGHMGTALVKGLLRSGVVKKGDVVVSTRGAAHAVQKTGVRVMRDNRIALKDAGIVFIAVKPHLVSAVLAEMSEAAEGMLIVSLAAGIPLDALKQALGVRRAYVARIMPNLPVAETQGVIGLFAPGLPGGERAKLRSLLENLGVVIETKREEDLDVITALSGSGPAVIAYLIEALAEAGERAGLAKSVTDVAALYTAMGTLAHLAAMKTTPLRLMEAVATKGGVTEAILARLEKDGVRAAIADALDEGVRKIKAIGEK